MALLQTGMEHKESFLSIICNCMDRTRFSKRQPRASNNTLDSGFVYDKQGHIVTNGHVVGDAKVVDVTFPDGNRYTAKVIASDIYSYIAVLQISQNASQPQRQLLQCISQ